MQTELGKAFLVDRALLWKDIKAWCSSCVQRLGKSVGNMRHAGGNGFSAVRSSVLEGVSYDDRAQKVQMRLEPIVILRNLYFCVGE